MRNSPKKAAFDDDLQSPLPDVLLPSQFFELVGEQTFSSEQRLMLAVLADAINALRAYRVAPNFRTRSSFNEASSWVFASGSRCRLSFERVCDALEVDAACLRRRLSELFSEHGGTLLRLRLKESSRIECLTANRDRHRKRRTL
jgi:hypothetical protein